MQLALIDADSSGFLIPCQLQGYYPCLMTCESLAATDTPFVPHLDSPVNCRVIRPGSCFGISCCTTDNPNISQTKTRVKRRGIRSKKYSVP